MSYYCFFTRSNTQYPICISHRWPKVKVCHTIYGPPLSGPPGLLVAATDGPPDHQWLP